MGKTHYDILGIAPNASQSDIKTAYYKLSKVYHPDKTNNQSSQQFMDITLAYEILGNDKTKKSYDDKLLTLGLQKDDFVIPPYYKFRNIQKFDPAYRGKKPIYDFDNWYHHHYSDAVNKRNERKYRYQQSVTTKTKYTGHSHNMNAVLAIIISMFAFSLFKHTLFDNSDYVKRKK